MKLLRKAIALGLICLFTLCSLCSCGNNKKTTVYQSYVQNLMDVNYKGIYTGYVEDNGGNESDAAAMHQECIDHLAEQLIAHYSLNNAQSLKIKETFATIAESIYSQAKYSVSESYKENGEYYVDVTIYPLNILNQSYDGVLQYIEQFNADVNAGLYNNYTKEQYEETFALGIANILTDQTKSMAYQDPITLKIAIVDDGEYYSISAEDLINIDQYIIAIEETGVASATDAIPTAE